MRTFEEQNALFSQGRNGNSGQIVTNAKGGQSLHNYGLAIDIVNIVGNEANYDFDWQQVSDIGKECGFEWGGERKMGMLFWNRCVGTVVSCSVLCNLFACNKMELKDIDTKQQIENYMEEFRNMYMSEICGLEQKIFIDVKDIYVDNLGYPLELTVYKNDKEEVVRYKVQLYGETGNSVTDYYLCKEFVYVNQEKEYYSSQILVEEYNDVLYRETNDWIIYGDEIYILQDDGQMKIDNNYSFYSMDEVRDWGK